MVQHDSFVKMRLRINNSVIEGVLFVVIAVIYGVDFGFGERLMNIADEVLSLA